MIDQAQTDKLREVVSSSKQALVIFPATKDLDLFLASYCLFTFLHESTGARLLSPQAFAKLPAEITHLFEKNALETELGKEHLLISFPYQEEQVDKVSYYIGEHDQRFYLTVKPKRGIAPLDSKDVTFTYAGADADLLLLLGVDDLEDLEQLYFAYESLYQSDNSHLVTLNTFIPDFGTLNMDVSDVSSYSEAVYFLLRNLNGTEDFTLSSEVASLLLYGIESKTQALQSTATTADTFLAVGELLRQGAKRLFGKSSPPVSKVNVSKTKRVVNESNQPRVLK